MLQVSFFSLRDLYQSQIGQRNIHKECVSFWIGSVQISIILDTKIKLHCLIAEDTLPSSLSSHFSKTGRRTREEKKKHRVKPCQPWYFREAYSISTWSRLCISLLYVFFNISGWEWSFLVKQRLLSIHWHYTDRYTAQLLEIFAIINYWKGCKHVFVLVFNETGAVIASSFTLL